MPFPFRMYISTNLCSVSTFKSLICLLVSLFTIRFNNEWKSTLKLFVEYSNKAFIKEASNAFIIIAKKLSLWERLNWHSSSKRLWLANSANSSRNCADELVFGSTTKQGRFLGCSSTDDNESPLFTEKKIHPKNRCCKSSIGIIEIFLTFFLYTYLRLFEIRSSISPP